MRSKTPAAIPQTLAAALALLIHAAERRGCDFMPIPFRFGKEW